MEPYKFLSENDALQLRAERLRLLEFDHYRACLALEENPEAAATLTDLSSINNAIRHHRNKLDQILLGQEKKSDGSPEPTVED